MKSFIIVSFLLLFSGTAIAMSDFVVPKTWNYKITIEVETPEGVKTGYAVRHVEARREFAGYINPGTGVVTYRVFGEAVMIDLGRYGILFHLLDWDSNSIVSSSFPRKYRAPWAEAEYYASLKPGTRTILSGWKSFVWIDTLDGPASFQRLDSNHFDSKFDGNVVLKQVIVEITDAPVSWNINNLIDRISQRLGSYSKESFQYKR